MAHFPNAHFPGGHFPTPHFPGGETSSELAESSAFTVKVQAEAVLVDVRGEDYSVGVVAETVTVRL